MLITTALTFGLLAATAAKPPASMLRLQPAQKTAYAEALALIRRELWDEALVRMEGFAQQYPESPLADNALYWMGLIYLHKQERSLAKDEFTRILKFYPHGDRSERADAQIKILEEQPLHESTENESHQKERL